MCFLEWQWSYFSFLYDNCAHPDYSPSCYMWIVQNNTHTCRFPTTKLPEMRQADSRYIFFNNSQPYTTWPSLHNLAMCPGMHMASELKWSQALTIRSMRAWDNFANLPPLFLFFLQYLFFLIWGKKRKKKQGWDNPSHSLSIWYQTDSFSCAHPQSQSSPFQPSVHLPCFQRKEATYHKHIIRYWSS